MNPDTLRQIRNMIPDQDAVFDGATMFTDENITDFFVTGFSNVFWAAGLAQMAIGNSELLIQKVITNYETKTDGATAQKQWLATAAANIALGKEMLANPYGDEFLDYVGVSQGELGFPYGDYVELLGFVPRWIGN